MNFISLFVAMVLFVAHLGHGARISGYAPPTNYAAPSNQIQVSQPSKAMPYSYQYAVDDSEEDTSFSQQQSSDGSQMKGQYTVLLPDGRTQTVTYYDNGGGFVAEVSFSE